MIKIIVSVLALGSSAAFGATAPTVPSGRVAEYEAAVRTMARAENFEPLLELTQRWQFEGLRPYRALMFGSYGRAHRNLKLGVFYRVQKGVRHDDDWTTNQSGDWFWRDTSNRPEGVVVLDATPRVGLGGHWTGSVKIRYEHNTFNGQRTLKLEPEIAWFKLDGLHPRATVFLRHGTYVPLNFGTRSYYERWWYLAGLWHPSSFVSVGPSVALRDEMWSASGDFRDASGGAGYRVLYRSIVWGFTLLIRSR